MSNAISALAHFPSHDFSWMAQFFTLLILPFAHEDLAIVLGAFIVVNGVMPAALVALCIYGGMVASDFMFYGIGAGARRMAWLKRLAVDENACGFAETLQRNLFGLVALCRLVPGVAFIALIACGWARVSLARFAIASFVVSALYLPLMFYLVIVFGDALDDHVGWWAWPALVTALAAVDFVRRRVFALRQRPADVSAADRKRGAQVRKLGLAEKIPTALFYLPLMLSFIRFGWRHGSLTLPSVANPRLPSGGRRGEARSDYLNDVAAKERNVVADFFVVSRTTGARTLDADLARAEALLAGAGLTFPVIAKPDIGWGAERHIDNLDTLRDYLRGFPAGARVLLQRFVPLPGEAAVLYARLPGTDSGRILSLSFRCQDGDGRERAAYRDARRYVTRELEARLDAIARGMNEFHYGRFDLRFASTKELMQGTNFAIIGISGVGAEAIDVRDPELPVAEIYHRFIEQQRIVFLIAAKNRARGFKPQRVADFLRFLIRRIVLRPRYPASA